MLIDHVQELESAAISRGVEPCRHGAGSCGAAPPPDIKSVQKPGNDHAEPSRLCGDAPDSEVSLGKILEHRLLQLGFCQKLFEPGVFLPQLSHPSGLLGLHAPILLPPAVVGRLRHLHDMAYVGNGLAVGDQLFGGFELADDQFRCVPGAFHGRVPGPVWSAENSHSPWTGFRIPRQRQE